LNQEILETKQENLDILALFALYFYTIGYWQDEDSGHWEETRKINASSIGVVMAGLKEFQKVLLKKNLDSKYKNIDVGPLLGELIKKGKEALRNILSNECIQNDPVKKRTYDAALLFLVYPLNVVNENMADKILDNIEENLLGDYGIRRYIGDSFWAPDYKKKVPQEKRTSHLGNDISERDTLLTEKGKEAQWCIFDPIISVIYGIRFQKTGQEDYLNKQIYFLNRSLGQITEEFECPELYYIEGSEYVHGDVVPLLWTQANLRIALKIMELNVSMD
jgi:phosphorylase kinase alpha/beta subunit